MKPSQQNPNTQQNKRKSRMRRRSEFSAMVADMVCQGLPYDEAKRRAIQTLYRKEL